MNLNEHIGALVDSLSYDYISELKIIALPDAEWNIESMMFS